jgi:hypothetical protein
MLPSEGRALMTVGRGERTRPDGTYLIERIVSPLRELRERIGSM